MKFARTKFRRVLLVEPDHLLAEMLTVFFCGANLEVVHCQNCESARQALQQSDFIAAIVDISCGSSVKHEFVHELQTKQKKLPIVLTANNKHNSILRLGKLLGNSLVCLVIKPFSSAEILHYVRALI